MLRGMFTTAAPSIDVSIADRFDALRVGDAATTARSEVLIVLVNSKPSNHSIHSNNDRVISMRLASTFCVRVWLSCRRSPISFALVVRENKQRFF